MIVFGRSIRDHIPSPPGKFDPRIEWKDLAAKKEDCFLRRHYAKAEDLTAHSKHLSKLQPGDHVYVQDQTGTTPRRWNKSGIVLECLPHDSLLVKIDGSGNITKRNRKFLRKFTPFNLMTSPGPVHNTPMTALPPLQPSSNDHPADEPLPPGNVSTEDLSKEEEEQMNTDRTPDQQPTPPVIQERKKPIKEKWILNPNYPSQTPSRNIDASLTAQGLLTDPACQTPGGGHREDPEENQDTGEQ